LHQKSEFSTLFGARDDSAPKVSSLPQARKYHFDLTWPGALVKNV